VKKWMKSVLVRIFSMMSQNNMDLIRMHFQDLKALALLPHFDEYIPWTEASMRPSAISAILNEILFNNRRAILECGSGISTMYIAKAMSSVNGMICSIDHSKEWLQVVDNRLKHSGIPRENYLLIHAPLTNCRIALDGSKWYDIISLDKIKDREFDMLVIDGPGASAKGDSFARFPAFPYFKSYMKDDFVVIIDDISRNGEKFIAGKWSKDYGLSFESQDVGAGIAILRPRGKENFNIL